MKWQFHNSLKILKQYYYIVFIQYKTWSWISENYHYSMKFVNLMNHAVFSINLSIQFNSTSTVHTRIKSFLSFQVTINRSCKNPSGPAHNKCWIFYFLGLSKKPENYRFQIKLMTMLHTISNKRTYLWTEYEIFVFIKNYDLICQYLKEI